MLLDRASLAARHACSTDAARLQLQGIQVRPDRATVGTNGHWLAIVSPDPNAPPEADFPVIPGFPEAEASPASPAAFLLPSGVCDDIFKALKANRRATHPILAFARVDTANSKAVVTDLTSPKQFSWTPDDRRFPDYEKIVDRKPGRFSVRLSVEYLEDICKAARECNDSKTPGITLAVRDSEAQVHLQAGRFFAVLMPLRGDKSPKPGEHRWNDIEYPELLKMEAATPEAEADTEAAASPATPEAEASPSPAEKAARTKREKVAQKRIAAEKAEEAERVEAGRRFAAEKEAEKARAAAAFDTTIEAARVKAAAAREAAEKAEAARLEWERADECKRAEAEAAARKAELEAARDENRRLRAAREKAEAEKAAELAARYDRERIAREAELAAEAARRLAAAEAFETSKRAAAELAARAAAAAEAEAFAREAAARLAELAALTTRPRCGDCIVTGRPYCDHMELARPH